MRYSLKQTATALLLSLVLLLAAAPMSSVAASGSKTTTRYAVTTTAVQIVSGNSSISHITVTNTGTVTAYLGASNVTAAAAASTDGDPLFTNCVKEYDGITDALYARTASGTADLRVVVIIGSGVIRTSRLVTTGIANGAAANVVPMSNGSDLVTGNVLIKNLSTAITPNSTTTSDASGSLAVTSNATGLGTVFRSDGTNYQLLANYSDFIQSANLGTVATTGNTDDYIVAAYAGTLLSIDCSSTAALTANNTNYVTATLTNLGQAGSGSTAMLAATAPNTSQATGGTGFAANTKRSLTISGTGGNLITAAGDRLLLRLAATGTLANTLTNVKCVARFNRLS